MNPTRRALALSTVVVGALLTLTPPVHASALAPGDCRSPNLLSSATFPNGTDIKPVYGPHGIHFPGRVCENGTWREY
ncbi:hypothetical protein [Streptosporangium subroseum]|uniref:hypothetical protein n=1 Tax=Streptosporangium subroseum TaxID=106412 RepID=UPI003086B153|nr:hypothetical protein OHB15_49575 [Streptosporangium subroseum]